MGLMGYGQWEIVNLFILVFLMFDVPCMPYMEHEIWIIIQHDTKCKNKKTKNLFGLQSKLFR